MNTYHLPKHRIMKKKNKKDKERVDHSTRLHQPQPSSSTTPVNRRSGDKLRENPSNDEETIEQNPRKAETLRTEQTPLSKQNDGGRNQVTNEDEQKEVINPEGGDWDEPEKDTTPKATPYESIDDDPNGTERKIPKM